MHVLGDASVVLATVAYQSRDVLLANMRLVAALNPDVSLHWWVAENSPPGHPQQLLPGDVAGLPFPVTLRVGVAAETLAISPQWQWARGSFHHGAALNVLMTTLQAAYPVAKRPACVVMDPDFYVLRPHWISDLSGAASQEGWGVLGAPWHGRYRLKWMDAPCAHFLWLSPQAVPNLDALNWLPGYGGPVKPSALQKQRLRQVPVWRVVDKLFKGRLLAGRKAFGTSLDTGCQVAAWLRTHLPAHAGLRLLTPLTTPAQQAALLAARNAFPLWERGLEVLLPDAWRHVPRLRPSRKETQALLEACQQAMVPLQQWAIPLAADALHAEWFAWQGQPFAVHLRQTQRPAHLDSLAPHALSYR